LKSGIRTGVTSSNRFANVTSSQRSTGFSAATSARIALVCASSCASVMLPLKSNTIRTSTGSVSYVMSVTVCFTPLSVSSKLSGLRPATGLLPSRTETSTTTTLAPDRNVWF